MVHSRRKFSRKKKLCFSEFSQKKVLQYFPLQGWPIGRKQLQKFFRYISLVGHFWLPTQLKPVIEFSQLLSQVLFFPDNFHVLLLKCLPKKLLSTFPFPKICLQYFHTILRGGFPSFQCWKLFCHSQNTLVEVLGSMTGHHSHPSLGKGERLVLAY